MPSDVQPDPSIDDLLMVSVAAAAHMDRLDPADRWLAERLIELLVSDVCAYGIACEHGTLAQAIADDPVLGVFGQLLPHCSSQCCAITLDGMEIEFKIRNGQIVVLGVARLNVC